MLSLARIDITIPCNSVLFKMIICAFIINESINWIIWLSLIFFTKKSLNLSLFKIIKSTFFAKFYKCPRAFEEYALACSISWTIWLKEIELYSNSFCVKFLFYFYEGWTEVFCFLSCILKLLLYYSFKIFWKIEFCFSITLFSSFS